MKKVVLLLLVCLSMYSAGFSQSNLCNGADPFCTGTTFNYPATTNAGNAETGPNYGCLMSQPNPVWYYMQIDQSGNILLNLHSNPNVDIDFAMWGPFTSPTGPCTAGLTATCTTCPNNTTDPNFYPSGNLVDCSYTLGSSETVHINNTVTGQYYLIMITNYSNQPTNILFDQTNIGQAGAGSTNCGLIFNASTDGSACIGETVNLFAETIVGATSYQWTGPNGFMSTLQNPVISNATNAVNGVFTCTVTTSLGTYSDTAIVVIHENPFISFANASVCSGSTVTLTAAGGAMYVWNTFENTESITVAPLLTTTYSVTGTDMFGCSGSATGVVTVEPSPTSIFSAPPVCGSVPPNIVNTAAIFYTGQSAAGASFSWTFSGPVHPYLTSVAPGPHNLTYDDPTVITNYNISLTVTNPTGCTSTTTQQIQVIPTSAVVMGCCINPPTNAGQDNAVCGMSYQLNGSVNPSTTGVWSVISGPGMAMFGNSSAASTQVTVSAFGQYSFKWTETSGSCDSSDVVNITFNQMPVANAGPDQIVCGNIANMAAIPSLGNGLWSGQNVNFSMPYIATTSAYTVSYGTFTYNWTETNGVCVNSDFVQITYTEMPQPNAGQDQNVCGNSVQLYGSSNSSNFSGYWTGSNGVIFSPSDTASNVNATILPFTSTHSETFWWHQVNGLCKDSDQVVITFNVYAGPGAISAGFDQSTCDTVVQLQGIIQGVSGTGQWSSLGQVIFDNSLDANTFVRINPSFTNFSADSSKYVAVLIWTVSNGQGCSSSDNVVITFFQTPHANAGFTENQINLAACGLSSHLNALQSISASYGTWNLAFAPAGCSNVSFNDQHNASAIVQTSCYGIYDFTWREQNLYNNQCSSTDTIRTEFVERPNISAGADQWVCGDLVYLHAVPSGTSTGQSWAEAPVNWLDPSLNIDPSQITNPTAIASHMHTVNDSVIFVWTEYNVSTIPLQNPLQCISSDEVIVRFYTNYPANDLVSETDTFQCGKTFAYLNAAVPPQGFGYWVDSTFAATEFTPPNSSFPMNLHDTAIVSTYGMHHFYWVVKNGVRPNGTAVCMDSSNVIPVRFIEMPNANSGGHLWASNPNSGSGIKWDTVCGNKLALHPILSGMGTVQWQTANANIKFMSNNSTTSPVAFDTARTTIYNSDIINPAYYEVYLSLDNSTLLTAPWTHGCIDKDTLRITFAQSPTAQIQVRAPYGPYCNGDAAPIAAEDDLHGQPKFYYWNFAGGNVDSVNLNTNTIHNINDSIYWVSWDTASGSTFHVVSLTTQNAWGCMSPLITDTIFEPAPQYPVDSMISATCNHANGRVILIKDCPTCVYTWTDTMFQANPLLMDRGNLAPEIPYHILLSYQSWNPAYTCKYPFIITVPNRNTSALNGVVTVVGNALPHNSAEVELLSLDNGNTLYTAPLEGTMHFIFNEINVGQYKLYVNITNDTIQNILNTYFNHTTKWIEADTLNFECDTTYSITVPMVQMIQTTGSPIGSISGTITYAAGTGGKGIRAEQSVLGEPVPGAEIYVELEPDDQPIANTTTDETGFFDFTGINEGHSYTLTVDIPGVPLMTTYNHIGISASHSVYPNLNFVVDTLAGNGIFINAINDSKTDKLAIDVYPNPANDVIQITCATPTNDNNLSIMIYDVSGKKVLDLGAQKSVNGMYNNTIKIKEIGLHAGIYWMNISIGKTTYLKKLVVE